MDFSHIEGEPEDTGYFNEPPERDIGPETSRDVILRDLRQMANDYTNTNLGSELTKMKKLENIYMLTECPDVGSTLKNVEGFRASIKEKKMMLDELTMANAKLHSGQRKKGPLAITDGSGIDLDVINDQNIDVKLHEMEKRIQEARRVVESRGTDMGMAEALKNYHEVFKLTMDSMENIARGRPPRTLPRMTSFREFLEDTEKTLMVSDEKRDAQVTKALKELKYLNRYNTFSSNKLPYMPELPYNYEEELCQLNIMSNDILEDLGVSDDVVEIPLSQFLENTPDVKPAKSIMKKIEDSKKKNRRKSKLKAEPTKVRFQCDQQK